MEWIKKIIEVAKLPTKFIITIFFVSSAVLFFSEEVLASLQLNMLIEEYGLYISLASLISGTFLCIEFTVYTYGSFTKKKSDLGDKIATINRIKHLDPFEKSVLREFFLADGNTIKLPVNNPIVAELINAGILSYVGRHGRMSVCGMLYNMAIPDFVISHLTNELLDFPNGEPSKEEIDYLKNNRPDFILSIQKEDALYNW